MQIDSFALVMVGGVGAMAPLSFSLCVVPDLPLTTIVRHNGDPAHPPVYRGSTMGGNPIWELPIESCWIRGRVDETG